MDTPTTVLERVGFPRNRHYTKASSLYRKCLCPHEHPEELRQLPLLTCQCALRSQDQLYSSKHLPCMRPGLRLQHAAVTAPLVLQVRMLSGGECRRLQLAAVLMARPNLLILDEARDLAPNLQTLQMAIPDSD